MAWPAPRCPRFALVLLVLVAACKDDPPAQSDETTGTTSTTGTASTDSTSGMSTSPPPMTTVDPDDTTFGAGCGPDPCPAMCRDCPATATCIASVWTCECECDTTTGGGDPCDVLDDQIDAWVQRSMIPAVDCGSPGPADAQFAWQTLHECSVIQAGGQGLRATWTLSEGSDPIEYGVAARTVERYELAWYERSATGLVQYSCTAITATPGCTVDVESPCLTCEGQAELAVLCDEGAGSSSGTGTTG